MKNSELLRAAKARIDSPEKWWHGEFPAKHEGSTCAYLALHSIGGDPAMGFLCEAIGTPTKRGFCGRIAAFNDAPTTTHADIMAMYDRAIALAEQEEAAAT